MIKKVNKIWGNEEWLVNNDIYCAKFLNLKRGFQSSLHYHKIKDETFYILKGKVCLEIESIPRIFKKGDSVRLRPLTIHRFKSLTRRSTILEVSTTHKDEDSIRIHDARKI